MLVVSQITFDTVGMTDDYKGNPSITIYCPRIWQKGFGEHSYEWVWSMDETIGMDDIVEDMGNVVIVNGTNNT